jgi:hypothetical protein
VLRFPVGRPEKWPGVASPCTLVEKSDLLPSTMNRRNLHFKSTFTPVAWHFFAYTTPSSRRGSEKSINCFACRHNWKTAPSSATVMDVRGSFGKFSSGAKIGEAYQLCRCARFGRYMLRYQKSCSGCQTRYRQATARNRPWPREGRVPVRSPSTKGSRPMSSIRRQSHLQ